MHTCVEHASHLHSVDEIMLLSHGKEIVSFVDLFGKIESNFDIIQSTPFSQSVSTKLDDRCK